MNDATTVLLLSLGAVYGFGGPTKVRVPRRRPVNEYWGR
jgi:hypothetical protein